ncbi:MAG: hypothetical protein SNF33_07070 [Candidatus Algichlamydia australiensis]|nr:hypothetical protein [Chlamydiales bacterium]
MYFYLATALLASPLLALPLSNKTDSMVYRFLDRYDNHVQREKLTYIGPMTSWGSQIGNFGVHVMSREYLNEDQARERFQKAVEDFVDQANRDPKMKNLIKPFPLTVDRVEFKLSFWGKEMERPERPHVAQMFMKNGHVEISYKENASEFLDSEVVSESYEKMIEKIKIFTAIPDQKEERASS